MEEVFEEDIEYVCDFEIGDKVVYPHHGAGLVMTKETRELMDDRQHQKIFALTRKAQRPASASDRLAMKVSTT